MRALAAVLLIGCGPAYAPVTAVIDERELPPLSWTTLVLHAETKLNPSCAKACEFGATFPDGGQGAWEPLDFSTRDGGFVSGRSQEVAVGSTLTVLVGVPQPRNPSDHSPPTDKSCVATIEVRERVEISVVRHSANGDTCTIYFR